LERFGSIILLTYYLLAGGVVGGGPPPVKWHKNLHANQSGPYIQPCYIVGLYNDDVQLRNKPLQKKISGSCACNEL